MKHTLYELEKPQITNSLLKILASVANFKRAGLLGTTIQHFQGEEAATKNV